MSTMTEPDARPARDKGRLIDGKLLLGTQTVMGTLSLILGTLVDELERRDLEHGIATLCIGGGMGIATIIERV